MWLQKSNAETEPEQIAINRISYCQEKKWRNVDIVGYQTSQGSAQNMEKYAVTVTKLTTLRVYSEVHQQPDK